MNPALNLLPTKSNQSSMPASKSSNSRSKSEAKTSFSDTLNNAVSQADEPNGEEQEQVAPENPMDSGTQNVAAKKNDTVATKEQAAIDSDKTSENATTTTEKNDLPTQNFTNSALATQALLAMSTANTPTANMPTVNTQAVASAGQVTTGVIEGVTNQTQTVTAASAFAPLLQSAAASVAVNPNSTNSQNTQTQSILPNVVQTGQESPKIPGETSSCVTDTVSGNVAIQGSLSQVSESLPKQALQVEVVPNQKITIVSPAAESLQNQVAQTETAATSEVLVSQTAAGLQIKTAKETTTPNANGKTTQQEHQPIEQVAVPAVETNQQERTLQSNLSGQEQKDSLADASTFKVAVKLPDDGDQVMNSSSVFAQNLDAVLVPTNGIMPSAKTVETQTPTTPFADVHQVLDQIVEQTKVIAKPENTEMVMKLKPEHLGELTLKVAIENGVVNASFHSNNPEVRSLIEASLPQLKQELANTGLKVDNVSVYAGLSQFQSNQEQNQNSRQQLMKFTNKRSASEFVEAIEGELTAGNIPGIGSQAGVDYRI